MSIQQPSDRRTEPRYQIPLKAILKILLPEDTFSVLEMPAIAADISFRGCRLRINKFDKYYYRKMLETIRYVKLQFEFRDGSRTGVHGRVVWVDYHNHTPADMEYCLLGIEFTKTPDEFRAVLTRNIAAFTANAETRELHE